MISSNNGMEQRKVVQNKHGEIEFVLVDVYLAAYKSF